MNAKPIKFELLYCFDIKNLFSITPLMSITQLRLAILSVLGSCADNLLCLMGIKCSSWVQVNVGTSNRTCLNPMGQEEGCPSVASANQMVARLGVKCLKMGGWMECSRPIKFNFIQVANARCAIFVLLLVRANAVPLIEQPNSSCMMQHDRMKWLVRKLRKQFITVSR